MAYASGREGLGPSPFAATRTTQVSMQITVGQLTDEPYFRAAVTECAKFFHYITATLLDPRVKNNSQAPLPHAARMKLFRDRLPRAATSLLPWQACREKSFER